MKLNNILYSLILSVLLVPMSCNKWLDVMPDNRAEVDTAEKISKLLISAYPSTSYILVSDYSSDNVDDFGKNNPNNSRLLEQIYTWNEVTESDNEDPSRVWQGCYSAIANANQALAAIEELGNTEELQASRGEALICRAYAHFILVNMFCKAYNPKTADTDLGIPYMEKPETELNPKYERGTVAKVYELMKKDIEEGLPLVNDASYRIPKYHFNEKAAYTFASRFYLFYGDWDEAIRCANIALGTSPAELLRDYGYLSSLPKDEDVVPEQYASTNLKCNFLVQTSVSQLGVIFGPFYSYKRFTHGSYLMQTELLNCAPWGSVTPTAGNLTYGMMYKLEPYIYTAANLDFTMLPRTPYQFQFLDPVAQTGYPQTTYVALSAEEALLNRAEAYVMQDKYTEALADINMWTANTLNPSRATVNLSAESIKSWADSYDYYEPLKPTPKKRLNPILEEIPEGSQKEAFIQALLYMRRIEFLQYGMRFFDVKRYGIEIYRRTLSTKFSVVSVDDKLTVNDERRALQIPKDVVTAGLTPNPR